MRRMPFNAEELEKFIILSGKFNFTDETLEHVLENELYGKIATELIECRKKGIRKGAIIEDVECGGCYVGEILDDGTATLINSSMTSATSVDLQIDTDDKNNIKLIISTAFEAFLAVADAPKMYRHQLTLNFDGEYKTLSLIVYSSSDLNVNTLEDLTTLLKPDSNTIFLEIRLIL